MDFHTRVANIGSLTGQQIADRARQVMNGRPWQNAQGELRALFETIFGRHGDWLDPNQVARLKQARPDIGAFIDSKSEGRGADPGTLADWFPGGALDTAALDTLLASIRQDEGQPVNSPDQLLAMLGIKERMISELGGPEGSRDWPATRFLRMRFGDNARNGYKDPTLTAMLGVMRNMPGHVGFGDDNYPGGSQAIAGLPPGPDAPPPGGPPPGTGPGTGTVGPLGEPATSYLARNPHILQALGLGNGALYNEWWARAALQKWVAGHPEDTAAGAILAHDPEPATLAREQAEQTWLAQQGYIRDPGTGQIMPTMERQQYEANLRANPRDYAKYFAWLRGGQERGQPGPGRDPSFIGPPIHEPDLGVDQPVPGGEGGPEVRLGFGRMPARREDVGSVPPGEMPRPGAPPGGGATPVPSFLRELLAGQIPNRIPAPGPGGAGILPDEPAVPGRGFVPQPARRGPGFIGPPIHEPIPSAVASLFSPPRPLADVGLGQGASVDTQQQPGGQGPGGSKWRMGQGPWESDQWQVGQQVPYFGVKGVNNLTPDERAALESLVSAGWQSPNDWYTMMQRLGPQGRVGHSYRNTWM